MPYPESNEVWATYENGTLKLDHALPLRDGERFKVTVYLPGGLARASAGIFPWRGSLDDLEELLGPDNHPYV